jgi:hypothetical protein
MKLNNVAIKFVADTIAVDSTQIFRDLSRSIKKSFNVPDMAFINSNNEWTIQQFSSHSFFEVIRPASQTEIQLMEAINFLDYYVQTNIKD